MRGFRAVLLCSCLWSSCISDLKPDVGPLAVRDQDVGGADGKDAGSGNGGSDADADAGPGEVTEDGAVAEQDAGKQQDAMMPDPGGCKIKDSDPSKDVLFSKQIKPILAACRCHNPEDTDPFAILESGLTIDGYTNFRKGGDNTGAKIIVAGNACDSIVLQKLSEMPPFGDRMPRDGPYLTEAERTLISDWIVEGARDN